jgi:DNA polymerase-3 subunit beta
LKPPLFCPKNHILKNFAQSVNEPVKIEFNKQNIYFGFESFSLTCKLIDAKYPNYEAVIPKENPNKLIIDRVSFFRTVRTASIYSNKTTHQVRLKIAGSELNVSAEDYDFNNAATERLTCDYKGDDMLANLDTEQVCLEMSMPNRAGILLPVNSENTNEEILMLVMPVMLNV